MELDPEFEECLSEYLGFLRVTAPAGHGRAERLSVFGEIVLVLEECLSESLGVLCVTASAGHGRAERLYEFLGVLYPFLAMLSLFVASLHPERDGVAEVAPARLGHRADPELIHANLDEPVEHLLRLAGGRYIDPRLVHPRVLPLVGRPVAR